MSCPWMPISTAKCMICNLVVDKGFQNLFVQILLVFIVKCFYGAV